MSHVFISYRSEDGEFAANLIRQLEDAGFQVWSDNERLRAGAQWREAIDQALREAFALVILLAPGTRASELMMYEWVYALGAGIEVIPVMIEETELHPRLEKLERLEFQEQTPQPWGKLIRRIQASQDRRRRPSFARRDVGDNAPSPFRRRPTEGGRSWRDAREDVAGNDVRLNDIAAGSENEVERLIEALGSANRDTRAGAARRLADLGDRRSVQPLVKLLRDEDWRVRDAAAIALGKMKAASAVVGLLETIRQGRPGPFGGGANTQVIGDAIREIGGAAVPVLIDALSDDDWRVRLLVVDLLGDVAEPDSGSALAGALRDPEWRVRWRAADALGKMGDQSAVPDLLEMLSDHSKDVRVSSCWALGKIGGEEAVPGLVRLLHDREWRVRWAAAEALWEIGEEAVPPLLETLRDEDEYVRRAAVRALSEIGENAVPALIDTLADTNWDVRWAAAAALQEIGEKAVEALVIALELDNWQAAWAAAETLKRIGTPEALRAVEGWRRGREDDPGVD